MPVAAKLDPGWADGPRTWHIENFWHHMVRNYNGNIVVISSIVSCLFLRPRFINCPRMCLPLHPTQALRGRCRVVGA